MRLIVFLLTSFIALSVAESGFAKKGEETPDPTPWLEQVTADLDRAPVGFPHRVAFIRTLGSKKDKKIPEFFDVDVEAFNKLGFFKTVDTQSVTWDYKLNPDLINKNPLAVISQLLDVDTFVIAAESGPWEVFRVVKGKRKTLAKAEQSKDLSAAGLYEWLPTALGWDGVVLAQEGGVLLVASTPGILAAPDIQALAVKESSRQFNLPANRKGNGLLSLSKIANGVGVFDIVFLGQGVKSLPVGTKLIIEKKPKN